MKSKKLLVVNGFERKGGAESVYQDTIIALSEHYDVYTASTQKSNRVNHLVLNNSSRSNFYYPFCFFFDFYNFFSLMRYISKNNIKVVVLHNYLASLSPSVMLAIKLSKLKRGLKVFQYLHDYHLVCPNSSLYCYGKSKSCIDCIGRTNKNLIVKEVCDRRGRCHSILKYLRFLVLSSFSPKEVIDQYISPSNFLKSIFVQDGITEDNIRLIRNSFSSVDLNYNKLEVQEKKSNCIKICYFGRVSDEKDLPTLIKAVSILANKGYDFKLTIIGDGEEKENLLQLAVDLGVNKFVTFFPFMDKKLLYKKVSAHNFFVLPSKCFENMPVSLIEAVYLKVYPIACNHGGMKEVINLIGCGDLFEVGSSKDLAEKIIQAFFRNDSLISVDFNIKEDGIIDFNTFKKILSCYIREKS